MAGVAFYPLEGYFALLVDAQEAPPQVFVGFFAEVGFLYPVENPALFNGIDHILGVGDDEDGNFGARHGFEAYYHSQQLHTVISGAAEALGQLLFVGTVAQNGAVAAGPGVAARRAIGEEGNQSFQ